MRQDVVERGASHILDLLNGKGESLDEEKEKDASSDGEAGVDLPNLDEVEGDVGSVTESLSDADLLAKLEAHAHSLSVYHQVRFYDAIIGSEHFDRPSISDSIQELYQKAGEQFEIREKSLRALTKVDAKVKGPSAVGKVAKHPKFGIIKDSLPSLQKLMKIMEANEFSSGMELEQAIDKHLKIEPTKEGKLALLKFLFKHMNNAEVKKELSEQFSKLQNAEAEDPTALSTRLVREFETKLL